jgi:hypothetical protein
MHTHHYALSILAHTHTHTRAYTETSCIAAPHSMTCIVLHKRTTHTLIGASTAPAPSQILHTDSMSANQANCCCQQCRRSNTAANSNIQHPNAKANQANTTQMHRARLQHASPQRTRCTHTLSCNCYSSQPQVLPSSHAPLVTASEMDHCSFLHQTAAGAQQHIPSLAHSAQHQPTPALPLLLSKQPKPQCGPPSQQLEVPSPTGGTGSL